MARDHARIYLSIWDDDDYRDLPALSQWLYEHLLTGRSLNFCGVADWRPARIAAATADLSADDVEAVAYWLEERAFVLIDRDSEEALIRSFVKHDGLMKSPNMAKALVKDHGLIASRVLRAVVVDQLKRLKADEPDLKGWDHLGTLLRKRSMTPAEGFADLLPNPFESPSGNPSRNPSAKGSATHSGRGSVHPSATPILPSSLPPFLPKSNLPYVSGPPDEAGSGDLGLEAHG